MTFLKKSPAFTLLGLLLLLGGGAWWFLAGLREEGGTLRHLASVGSQTRISRQTPALAGAQSAAAADLSAGRAFTLVEHERPARYRLALDEVYDHRAATHERTRRIEPQADAAQLVSYLEAQAAATGTWPGMVIYPADGPTTELSRRILTGQVLIQAQDRAAAEKAARAAGLRIMDRPDYARDHLITEAVSGSPLDALDALAALAQEPSVLRATPLLMRRATRALIPNDPLFGEQWHLNNTGQGGGKAGFDIGVKEVWDQYQGEGIRIAIVDDGLETTHPDLAANSDASYHYDWNDTPPDSDPSPNPLTDYHGTAVGGVAGARGGNAAGVSGVAPKASLAGFRLISGEVTDAMIAETIARSNNAIQVKNNSWGFTTDMPDIIPAGSLVEAALEDAATNGRGGLGTISVWSSGNGRAIGDQGNKSGLPNNIHAIAVGAVTNKGALARFSEFGSHLCVVGPSSSGSRDIATTDLTGAFGLNDGSTTGELADTNYTNGFGGTSASAPIVSAVAALMLQANPALGWRDVKEIFLRSSTQIGAGSGGWVTRSGGDDPALPLIKHHYYYGGGLVNAGAAVGMAKTWTKLGPMTSVSCSRTVGVTIKHDTRNYMRVGIDFADMPPMRVEHVTVTVNITHPWRGQLALALTSPSGFNSPLAFASSADLGENYDGWTFSSTRHWGESGRGLWVVECIDTVVADNGVFDSATITLYGTEAPAADIATQPMPQLVGTGEPATFSAAVTGYGHITRQWRKNRFAIKGATATTLSLPSAKLTDVGSYDLAVQNLTGGDTSTPVPLGVVTRAVAPQTVNEGGTAIYKVTAAGTGLSYQWFRNSVALTDDARITGARTPTLTIRQARPADAAAYTCRVSMAGLTLDTQPAALTLRLRPVLETIESGANLMVSEAVSHQFIATHSPTRFAATGLPPGMILNTTTGVISGRPDVAGIYTLRITASNAAGTSDPITIIVEVENLPTGTVGTFSGLVERHSFFNGGYGGAVTLTTTSTGAFSGRITRGVHSHSFTGRLDTLSDGTAPAGSVSVPRLSPYAPLTFAFTLPIGTDDLEGTLAEAGGDEIAVQARRAAYSASRPATAYIGAWNTALSIPSPLLGNSTYPQGCAWGIQTVSSAGSAAWSGRLADGTPFTSSSGLAEQGQTALHAMLYTNSGSVQGWHTLNVATQQTSALLNWVKSAQPAVSTTRSYKAGFPLHDLTGLGSKYTPPTGAALVLGLPLTVGNISLIFSQGGLAAPFVQTATVAAGNLVVFPTGSGNPHQLKLTLAATTGMLTGTGSAMDIDPVNPALLRQRPGTFSGVLLPVQAAGAGHFLLPASPSATSAILSGRFDLPTN